MKNAKQGTKKSVSPVTANIAPYSTKGPAQSNPYGMIGGYSNPSMSPLSQAPTYSNPMMPAYGGMQTTPLGMYQSPCCGKPGHPGKGTAGAFSPNSGPGMMPAYPQQIGGLHSNSMPGSIGSMPGSLSMQHTMPVGGIGGGTDLPIAGRQESYIENILRLNLGKRVTIYMTFENNTDWNAKIFKGKLQAAGRDHIIISDTETGKRYLLLMIYLDYITFDEPIEYAYPYHTGVSE